MTLGHTRSRYFRRKSAVSIPSGDFRPAFFASDHDQAYQQTVVLRYQRPRNAEWIRLHLAL